MARRPSAQTNVPGRHYANYASEQLGVSFANALSNGLTQALDRIPKMAGALGAALKADLLQSERARVNQALALGAARAVHEKYVSRSPNAHSGNYGSDRPGTKGYKHRRYAGILGPLLAEYDMMAEGTTRSRINFLNSTKLNEEAPHWRRLNFGAGSAHGANPKAYQVTLIGPQGGQYGIATLQFPDLHADAIKFPQGFFGGQGHEENEFTPELKGSLGEWRAVSSHATQFADAGLLFIAQNAGREYVRMFNRTLENPRTRRAVAQAFGSPIHAGGDVRSGISIAGGRVARV